MVSPIRTRRRFLRRSAGFTLVELLVVIIIIAILAGLLIPIINAARNTARNATIAVELNGLEMALEEYKSKNGGDYPPDWSDPTQVANHLSRGFPRHNRGVANTWIVSQNDPTQAANSSWVIDPAEALVFWLSAVKKDVMFPLTSTTTSLNVYFDFKAERLRDIDGDGYNEYYPAGIDTAPYCYFNSRTYGIAAYPNATVYQGHAGLTAFGEARAYGRLATMSGVQWTEPAKFQIVCAGLDADFGGAITLPTPGYKIAPNPATASGANLTKGDWDNLTSFGKGKTIEALQP